MPFFAEEDGEEITVVGHQTDLVTDDLAQLLFWGYLLGTDLLQPALEDGDGTLEHADEQFFFARAVTVQGDPRDAEPLGHGLQSGGSVTLLPKAGGCGLQDRLFPQSVLESFFAAFLVRHALRLLDSGKPCKRVALPLLSIKEPPC